MLGQSARFLRTVKHLRWSQWTSRAQRWMSSLCRPMHSPLPMALPALTSDFSDVPLVDTPDWNEAEFVSRLEQGELRLLHQDEHLGQDAINWRLGSVTGGRLWTVTLHYHQWLFELARCSASASPHAQRARPLFELCLASWLACCGREQPGAMALAWNSYAIATRLGWSIRAWRLLQAAKVVLPSELSQRWRASLFQQAEHLAQHLEWDLRGNHLLRDAVGLAWAGRFFGGQAATNWLRKATDLALQQAGEQMLPDGGHFERSPFYHLEVMDDWFTLAHLLSDERARHRMREVWLRAAEYACWLRHPDGRVVQLNDGAAVLADKRLALATHFGAKIDLSPRRGGRQFADSGVVVWHGSPWSVFFDVGAVGPDYQPGHAHADTLTVECSYHGTRLFVDPGCHSYDRDDRRRYDRSTAAHNTVCVDDENSSEVWHIFRVGRRARPIGVRTTIGHDGLESIASHTGYNHLPGRPKHQRQVVVGHSKPLIIRDRVTGVGEHNIAGGFLLSPGWTAKSVADGWRLKSDNQDLLVRLSGPANLQHTLSSRPWHPDYGIEVMTQRLHWQYRGPLPVEITICIAAA